MGELNEMVEIRKWVLGLVAGLPSLTVLLLMFSLGQWRGDIEARLLTVPQKERALYHMEDKNQHWDFERLDSRYMPKRELEIHLTAIRTNQEKLMKKFNVE